MKIMSIVGARPQFIKCAPLSREIRRSFDEVLVHTGQHYDDNMSRIFFDDLGIPKPDYNLDIHDGSHAEQTGRMLIALEPVLVHEEPDLVLVYGDTNTTLAGALVAAKLTIPLAHVEAGLRAFDRSIPEEINRILTDRISDLLFCPTPLAVMNLRKEGFTDGVHLVGDVMVDALLHNREIADRNSSILEDLDLEEGEYLVATVHRQANTNDRENLEKILRGFEGADRKIVFPAHPRTIKFLKKHGLLDSIPGEVRLTEPLGYIDMIKLMAHARKIVTDSGGIQKEAYLLKVPCITLRENTEWTETVQAGWNILVGTDAGKIRDAILDFNPQGPTGDLYGKGDASRRIVSILRAADLSPG